MGSWMWRKLLKYRELAKSFVKMEVGNGATTSFWYDHWSDLGRLIEVTGERGFIDLGIQRFSTVEQVILTHRRKRHRSETFNKIEELIRAQREKQSTVSEDIVLWRRKGDKYISKFVSNETWNLVREVKPIKEWWKGIWFTYYTPKYAFHSWLAINNRLSTADRMLQWSAGGNGSCVLCQNESETRNHLYFSCSFSEQIWTTLVKKLLQVKFTTDWNQIIKLLVDTSLEKVKLFLLRYAFQTTLHTVWRERNNRRHGEDPKAPTLIAKIIDKQVRNRLSSIRDMGDQQYEKGMMMWFATRQDKDILH